MFIVTYRKMFLAIGLGVMIASIVIIATLGLRFGIDFTGGSLTEVSYTERPEKTLIESALNTQDLGGYSLRETVLESGRSGYVLRTRDLSEPERVAVEEALTVVGTEGAVERFTSIGPVIGEELRDKAVWAIGAVVLVIILYVAFAFAGVGRPVSSWAYGGITIFALAHDVLVPTALMSVLGHLAGVEVDVLFVMALLAVLGYSVNDTIVVFDRVRENLVRFRQEKKIKEKDQFNQPVERIEYIFNKPFAEVVGLSVTQTLTRSINTSVTTGLALLALYIFGGEVTRTFALILLAGVVAGTYSSIFLANPLLVWWSERQDKNTQS